VSIPRHDGCSLKIKRARLWPGGLFKLEASHIVNFACKGSLRRNFVCKGKPLNFVCRGKARERERERERENTRRERERARERERERERERDQP
jgi:hypothetical protein